MKRILNGLVIIVILILFLPFHGTWTQEPTPYSSATPSIPAASDTFTMPSEPTRPWESPTVNPVPSGEPAPGSFDELLSKKQTLVIIENLGKHAGERSLQQGSSVKIYKQVPVGQGEEEKLGWELAFTGGTAQEYVLEPGNYKIVVKKDCGLFHYLMAEDFTSFISGQTETKTLELILSKRLRWERIIPLVVLSFLMAGGIISWHVLKSFKVKDREVSLAKTALTRFQTMTKTQGMPTQGVPTQIDRFIIQEQIGQGGFASVYRVTDEYGDTFALKVPHFQIFNVPEYRARFKREADIIKNLHHSNIVKMFDYSMGENYTVPYICFEYVEGITLKQYIQKQRILPIKKVVKIAIEISEALEYAHSMGIIHRDVKPENVMLTPKNEIKLMDLGIARTTDSSTLTGTGKALGTPFYFAPEQVDACNIDGRADLYALGVVIYEMLTGHLPFDADRPVNVILKHINEIPKPPSSYNIPIPGGLEEIVMRLMEKKPENRYQSAGDLKNALKHFL